MGSDLGSFYSGNHSWEVIVLLSLMNQDFSSPEGAQFPFLPLDQAPGLFVKGPQYAIQYLSKLVGSLVMPDILLNRHPFQEAHTFARQIDA